MCGAIFLSLTSQLRFAPEPWAVSATRRSGLRSKRRSVRSIIVFAAPTSAWRMARDASAANRVATTESLRAEAINHFRNKIGTKRTSQNVGAFVRFRGAADKHARVASTALDVN